MGPSVKNVLGALEWSYVVPEKSFLEIRVWFGLIPPPPGLEKHQTFYVIFLHPSPRYYTRVR